MNNWKGFESPITLAADESCLHTGELETAARRYSMINIKLDKTGGLTEALRLAKAAKDKRLQINGRQHGRNITQHGSLIRCRTTMRFR